MKDRLLIFGASGHGKVVADVAIKMNKWQCIEFLDDDESIKTSMGVPVIGKFADLHLYKQDSDFFVAIGNNSTREQVLEMLIATGTSVAKLLHPHAIIGPEVVIGMGTVVMAGVVINASSVIGKGCIINTSSSIDHDNIIENYVHISPGTHLAGNVYVGKGSWIGIGSAIINNVNICSGCRVGAGAVVVRDITESGTYVGVPVRRIDK